MVDVVVVDLSRGKKIEDLGNEVAHFSQTKMLKCLRNLMKKDLEMSCFNQLPGI